MNYWQAVDWEYEIEARLNKALRSNDEEESASECAIVGRYMLLMQEYLPPNEYHNILWAIDKPHLLQYCFLQYLTCIGRFAEINSQTQQ